jgi:2-polyprenyl-6-methoxyphenol hydroxylase-like FAD-dependent oxidoreductase
LLLEAAQSAGAELTFSCGIESSQDADGRILLTGRGGQPTHGPFDLLLACDGTHSRLRDQIAPGARVRQHARGVYSVVAPMPKMLPADTPLQCQNQPRDGAGLLPIGHASGEQPLVSFFWNARPDERPAVEALGFSAWCDYIEGFCPEAGEFLRGLGGFSSLTYSTTAEVALPRWHGARALLMGDAAHALNPQLGLGATMALLDAASLARALADSPGDLAAALARHESRRRPHVEGYARISRSWSFLDHLRLAPLRRGMFLAMANGYPAMRRRLLAHVCGYAYLPAEGG